MHDRLNALLTKIPALRSVKVYIFLLLLAMGILPSFVMRYGILQSYENRAVSLRISDTQAQFTIIANHLLANNYLQDTSNAAINAELEQISTLYDGRVLIINNSFHVVKDTYGISEGKTIISAEVIRCFKGENTTNYERKGGYIEMTIPIMDSVSSANTSTDTAQASPAAVQGVLLASVSTESIRTTIEIMKRSALIIEIVMIICIFGISVGLSSILIRPFNRVTQAINEVKDGFTDEPISVKDYRETEQIVDAFNQLLNQMKVIDDSRQEFVANVSHELKTPLTSMKVLADSLMQMGNAPIELYQEFMQDIAAEIERENKIINDLLSLVKMDKTAAQLSIETVDINELIELVLKRLRPIARTRDVEVVFESIRPVTAEVDEVKITQAFTNLVENAIKYNKEHGWVKVLLDADHQFFTVEISDSGIGIPEADYDHIFERFYRVDKSHSREIGGTGLGLAITRNAILLHRGSIKVNSVEGEGTCFTVKIPLTYVKQ
ncbi:MAG TPA: two-component sensor histidine kinase [Candidatus Eisenbergiella merdipullorum]|uniref:histidine kinase n=1 Tax=Candidatus Eisenbergiella merdipullorum TaxID=2838553 RepID=A0A9D2I4Q1_9FIRM|nr:two-component sensor histidine kinase [Candidatus Eisenbergiella merdipullorum]